MTVIWRLFRRLVLALIAVHLAYLLYCRWFFPPITLTQLHSLLSGQGLRRDYVPLERINPQARLAVIAAEDQKFATHKGFDWASIREAWAVNERKGRTVRGASTITQQVAKNVFLWQGRSWLRKGLEGYFTLWLELLYSKRRILELYLNVIEMGKGIYGIECAAQVFFGKSAAQLTEREAAMIAASLPNPKLYTVKPTSRWVQRRHVWVMRQMRQLRGQPELEQLLESFDQ
ncbi:MAG: monofunctional biosynthetic peptidoglycan transglycosylase [Chitinophagales bacterium]|nr:monofunctional biosynthetic peptidoglycan transglycosylase [Chitinophagales bacterium]MDW8393840.1 monofunctional biosynthetic peptidoglycan transglycosylase [Chitinophagales bacterium]